jgi:hypothetical protein
VFDLHDYYLSAMDGTYWYIHINNDTPGTDDGKNPKKWILAPGIHEGSKVKAGQFIAYMGDSGDTEGTQPHLHFEVHTPNDVAIDPYTSLRLAQGLPAEGLCSKPSNPTPDPFGYSWSECLPLIPFAMAGSVAGVGIVINRCGVKKR